MKRFLFPVVAVVLLGLALVCFFSVHSNRDARSEEKDIRNPQGDIAQAGSDLDRDQAAAKGSKALHNQRRSQEKSKPFPNPSRDRLLKGAEVLQEQLVANKSNADRWTVRQLLNADFKYPHLRVDRDWSRDDRGEDQLLDRRIFVADHVLVRFPEGVELEEIRTWAAKNDFELRSKLKTAAIHLVATREVRLDSADILTAALKTEFGKEATIERDYIIFPCFTPDDSSYASLWGLHNTGQSAGTIDADIDAPEAWNYATGSRDILVGVIDTGLDHTHADLAANTWTNPNEIAGNGIDDDNNGLIDDDRGWDFYENDNTPNDTNSHGTHCAGTIGAVGNNARGVVGVNWEVSMVGIKFLGNNGGSTSDAIDAVGYGTTIGVDLTSNSWGGGGYSSLLESAIQDAGDADILFVAAAGNESTDADRITHYPSSYALDNVIAVAATDDNDNLSSFSNYGALSVDLGAPGSDIYSTEPGGAYGYKSGTSMATPQVSGAIALLKSMSPNMTASELKAHLFAHLDPIPALSGTTLTGGRLNIGNAAEPLSGPLVRVSSDLLDVTSGNGDAFLNPGENADLVITLINSGSELATGLNATLSADSAIAGITLNSSSFALPDLAAGASATALRFPVTIASNVPTPTSATFTLTVTDSTSNVWTSSHQFSVYTSSSISGMVTSLADGTPIPDAVVAWSGALSGSVNVDAGGLFSITTINGDYEITASAPGFVSSSPVTVTTPPGQTSLNLQLGLPDLVVSPLSINETIFAGSASQASVLLRNDGNIRLDWTALISIDSNVINLANLPSSGDNTPAQDEDLIGRNIAMMASSSVEIVADLESRGATLTSLYFPLTTASLDGFDCLILGEDFSGAASSDVTIIRDWVENGGGAFIASDDAQINVNLLLQDTDLTTIDQEYLSFFSFSQGVHPIVESVPSVEVSAAGAYFSVSGSEPVPLLLNQLASEGDNKHLAVATQVGAGRIVALANEIDASMEIVEGDSGRLFINQAVGWLANASRLIGLPNNVGSLEPGESYQLLVDLDATNQLAGQVTGSLIIRTNEPANPKTTVPIIVTVIGAPAIAADPSLLSFPDTFVNGSSSLDLTLSNPGTDDLIISSIGSSSSAFTHTETLPLILAPRSDHAFSVRFGPMNSGDFDGNLSIVSNASAAPNVTVPLLGRGVFGPEAEVNPGSFTISLPFGGAITESFTVSNTGDSSLNWQLFVDPPSASADSFDELRVVLNESGGDIAALVPNRFDFTDGESGTYIYDGGSDMYDYGNYLSFDDLASLGYTGGELGTFTSSSGTTNRYFTSKVPGLFVLGAELDDVSSFEIDGGLGADSVGSSDASTLSVDQAGYQWRGFVKRVYGASVPSVNHLIIVKDDPSLQRTVSTSTNDDDHSVTGLQSSTELYYLLFASSGGQYIDDLQMEVIMRGFLDTLTVNVPWLDFDQSFGTVAAGGETEINLLFDALRLPSGTYDANLSLASDDTSDPRISIPVSFTITPAPLLVLDKTEVGLPDTDVGTSNQSFITLTNEGVQNLGISSINLSGSSMFTLENFDPVSLVPGASMSVRILFTPTGGSAESASLEVVTDDIYRPSITIPVTGNGVSGNNLSVSPTSLDVTIESGAQGLRTLTLDNDRPANVNFASTILPIDPTKEDVRLSGVRFAVMDTTTASHVELQNYLTSKIGVSPRFIDLDSFTESSLEDVDVIFLDSSIESIPAAQLVFLRSWISEGGAVLIQASGSSYSDTNSILSGFGITSTYSYYSSQTYYTTGEHSIVDGLQTISSGTNYTYRSIIPGPNSVPILRSSPDPLADTVRGVIDESSGGRVAYFTNFFTTSSNFAGGSSKVFLENVLIWLARGGSDWLSATPEEGIVSGNSGQNIDLHFDATDLYAGEYYANMEIEFPLLDTFFNVPVRLTVTGEPDIGVNENIVLFASPYVGYQTEKSFTIVNQGTATLTIDSITLPDPDLALAQPFLPTLIQPEDSITLQVIFAPTSSHALAGDIEITSDDPDLPIATIPVAGSSIIRPIISTNTSAIELSLMSGATSSDTISFSNQGEADLVWSAATSSPSSRGELADSLVSLLAKQSSLSGLISSLEPFIDGGTGYCIADGGNDMYDTGNCLRTDLTSLFGNSIAYTSGALEDGSAHFGSDTSYFTLKLPDMFILSAELNGCDRFEFFGETGIESYDTGSVVTSSLNFTHHGVAYQALLKRSYGTFVEPSVNHLVLVEESSSLAHTSPTSLDDDGHTITGLSNSSHLHALVFGGIGGTEITESEVLSLAREYLTAVSSSAEGLSLQPSTGITLEQGSSTVTLTVDAAQLYSGTYHSSLIITSNDPVTPEVTVPVTVVVSGEPEIIVDPVPFVAQVTAYGGSSSTDLILHNSGTSLLTVSTITTPMPFWIDASALPLSIAPGESGSIPVTFSPVSVGFYTGSITINSDAVNTPSSVIDAYGFGVAPAEVSFDQTELTVSVGVSAITSDTLNISNLGSSNLHWDAAIRYQNLSSTSVADLSGVKILISAYSYAYSFDELVRDLEGAGAEVLLQDDGVFQPTILDEIDLLILPYSGAIQQDHPLAINEWIANGGALLIDCDSTGAAYRDQILDGSGVILQTASVSRPGIPEMINYDQTTLGLEMVRFSSSDFSTGFSPTSSSLPLISWEDGTMAATRSSVGSGKVAAYVGAPFHDGQLNTNDNLEFMYNLVGWLTGQNDSWLTLSQSQGTTGASDTSQLNLDFSAINLVPGTYQAELLISTDDPDQLQTSIPVNFNVTHAPEVTTDFNHLGFEPQELTFPDTQSITITNGGYGLLNISDISPTGDFAAAIDATLPVTLAPGRSLDVAVTFQPTVVGTHSEVLTITSDALTNPSLQIPISGIGLPNASIALSQSSIDIETFDNLPVRETLTITNNGGSPLRWEFQARAGDGDGGVSFPPDLSLTTIGFLTRSSSYSASRAALESYGAHVTTVALPLQLSLFESLDVLFLDDYYISSFTAADYAMLNAWITDGGKMFLAADGSDYSSQLLHSSGITLLYRSSSYNELLAPLPHPITDSVATLTSYYPDTLFSLSGDAISLVNYSNGTCAAALSSQGMGRIIAMNEGLFSVTSPENSRFFVQAIAWLSGQVGWLQSSRTSGTIPPGGASDVDLDFLSSDLELGVYEALLLLSSNDPLSPELAVPVKLTISALTQVQLYDTWRQARFGGLGALTGFDEDWNGDLISNGMEFFFAVDLAGKENLPKISSDASGIKIEFTARTGLPDKWLEWSCSEDLISWDTADNLSTFSQTVQNNANGTSTSTLRFLPEGQTRHYFKCNLPIPETE